MDAERDTKEIWREHELMAVDLEGRLDYLLGDWRDLRKRLREEDRERDDSRDKAGSLVI